MKKSEIKIGMKARVRKGMVTIIAGPYRKYNITSCVVERDFDGFRWDVPIHSLKPLSAPAPKAPAPTSKTETVTELPKDKFIKGILANTVYMPDSGLYKSLDKSLRKLSAVDLGALLTLINCK